MKRSSLHHIVAGALCLTFAACATPKKTPAPDPRPAPGVVPDEVSLRADRKDLRELRQDVPPEVQRENDELAFIRDLMAEGTQEPNKVRERFTKALRDRREKHDKLLRRRREEFTKNERREREDFLRKQKADSAAFTKKRTSSSDRQRFFEDQDERRRAFFSAENDKRRDFETQMTEERRTFEDYARERSNAFNEELRAYSTGYYERKKANELKKKTEKKAGGRSTSPVSSDGFREADAMIEAADEAPQPMERDDQRLMEELRNPPKGPVYPLGPGVGN